MAPMRSRHLKSRKAPLDMILLQAKYRPQTRKGSSLERASNPAFRSSCTLTPEPGYPTYNFFIKDNAEPPMLHSIPVRENQAFGPILADFCSQNNKRFRFDWNFVFFAPAPTPENPHSQSAHVLKWGMKPSYFMDPSSPVMKDGDVINLIEGSLEEQESNGIEDENACRHAQTEIALQEKVNEVRQLEAQLTEALVLIDRLKKDIELLKVRSAGVGVIPPRPVFNTKGLGRSILMGNRGNGDANPPTSASEVDSLSPV